MSNASWTRGRPFDPSTHRRLRKYQIRHAPEGWWARVPYGMWQWFETWDLAALHLSIRHEERRLKEERRARRECERSASHA